MSVFTSMDDARLRKLKEAKLHMLKYEGLRFYEPSVKQYEWHSNQSSIRALTGANKSGKSFAGTAEMLNIIGGVHQYRPNYTGSINGRDCCVDFDVLNQVLLPIYQQMVPRTECKLDGLTYEGNPRIWPGLKGESWETAYSKTDRILSLGNDSKIEFKSYSEEPDSYAGPVCHAIRMDEEPPEFVFNENLARQMTTKVNIMFTLTPLNYSQWLYHAIVDGSFAGRCFLVKMTYRDNPYINEDVVRTMESIYTDPAERAARLEGEFTFVTGRVYKEYGAHNFVDPMPIPAWYHKSVIIDPHPQKATAVLWIAEDERERYIVYREMLSTGTVQEICNEIIAKSAGEMIDMWLIDPSSGQSAGIRGQGSLISEFRKMIPVIEANNAVEYGIECVRRAVQNKPGYGPSLLVQKNCPTTHGQMMNYSWQRPKLDGQDRQKPSVVKKNDDFCDNIRYRIIMGGMKRMNQVAYRSPVALYGR